MGLWERNVVPFLRDRGFQPLSSPGLQAGHSSTTKPRGNRCRMRFNFVLLKYERLSLTKTSSGWEQMLLYNLDIPFNIDGRFPDVQVPDVPPPPPILPNSVCLVC